MKKTVRFLSTTLALLAVVCTFLAVFTSCGDDDDPVTEVTYSWGFSEMSSSSLDFMDDINKISSAFAAALGAPASASRVTKNGTPEVCDKEVREACRQASDKLKGESWQGHYTFVVTNVTTGEVVYSQTFDADDENII